MQEHSDVPERTRSEWAKDKGLWALLVFIGLLSPFGWALTARFTLSFYPIHLILSLYIGYRMGRWYGAAAGLAMTASWFLWDPVIILEALEELDVLTADHFRVRGFSWQDVLIAALLGWGSGYLIDRAEAVMVRSDLFMATWFPRRRDAWLERGARKVAKLFRAWGNSGGEESADDSDKLRYRAGRAGQLVIVFAVLIVLNLYVTVELVGAEGGYLVLSLIPSGLAAVLLIALGFVTASYIAVLMALLVWVGTWIGSLSELPPFGLMYQMGRTGAQIDRVAEVIGVAILTWLAVRFSRLHRGGQVQAAVLRMVEPCRRNRSTPAAATMTTILPVVFLFFVVSSSFSVQSVFPQSDDIDGQEAIEERSAGQVGASPGDPAADLDQIVVTGTRIGSDGTVVEFTLLPWVLIFSVLIYLGATYDPRGVSNRFIATFAVFLFLEMGFHASEVLTIATYQPDIVHFLLLTSAPFVGRFLDLKQLALCRAAIGGGWLLSFLLSIYIYGSVDEFLVRIPGAPLASLALQVVVIEGLARLLHDLETRKSH